MYNTLILDFLYRPQPVIAVHDISRYTTSNLLPELNRILVYNGTRVNYCVARACCYDHSSACSLRWIDSGDHLSSSQTSPAPLIKGRHNIIPSIMKIRFRGSVYTVYFENGSDWLLAHSANMSRPRDWLWFITTTNVWFLECLILLIRDHTQYIYYIQYSVWYKSTLSKGSSLYKSEVGIRYSTMLTWVSLQSPSMPHDVSWYTHKWKDIDISKVRVTRRILGASCRFSVDLMRRVSLDYLI